MKLLSQYVWRDEHYTTAGPGNFQSGLLFENNTPKKSAATFRNPFFIDKKKKLFWGQVRPGGAHTVTLKQENGPGSGQFDPIGTVGTDARGFFKKSMTPASGANYLYEYDLNGTTVQSGIVRT